MSTTVFVYKAAQEIAALEIDTEYELDLATAGTRQHHLEGGAAATLRYQSEQDQACDNRQDSWKRLVGFGPASCVVSTVKLLFQIKHSWF